MRLLDLTLATPAENLALDEALLEQAEATEIGDDVLRLWESPSWAVVVGRASKVAVEVRRAVCDAAGVPVLRRSSGGATVVIGPGCLMYGVVLSYARHPGLEVIDYAHRFVLSKVLEAVRQAVPLATFQGTSDLTLEGRKFSGNSLRCKRSHLLYHGTLLYDFPLDRVAEYLDTPPRQPEYRAGRGHGDFVTNLPVSAEALRAGLIQAWGAHEPLTDWPRELTAQLVRERYSRADWNERL